MPFMLRLLLLEWQEGNLVRAVILSEKGRNCKLLLPMGKEVVGENGVVVAEGSTRERVVTFATKPGQRYIIQ